MTLHTHLIVRDDALALYGFHAEQERDLFLMLLSVQAVGPKVALAVLSGGSPRELIAAIAAGDAARFQAVPGIGKRTAERIIVELREKVVVRSDGETADESILASRGAGADADDTQTGRGLARAGLIELGYAPGEADSLLTDAEGESAEELLAARAAPGSVGRMSGEAIVTPETARIQTPYLVAEDELDRSLRPRRLEEFVGQAVAARAARGGDRGRQRRAARRSTTCCWPGRPAWARPRWRRSSPPSSKSRSCRRPARRSSARATSLRSSPRSSRAACSSSMRSTASRARWRRRSTRRWRTAGCRSPSARAPAPASSRSTCRRSR